MGRRFPFRQKDFARTMTAPALDLDLAGNPADTRIVVAMSGGVDSSVTAALLAEAGYDVVGVTLQLYDHGSAVGRKGACCAGQDIHDARRVAADLGIPHYVLDYENRFRDAVMQDFADAYVRGETPIPCVQCNDKVKFADLLETARDLGAAALATGHYVARRRGPDGPELHAGADPERDQSYFLFTTTRNQLDFLRFPLGELTKAETRALAERYSLPVASKPDSQDICFVPNGRYADIVEKLRPDAATPGNIVDLAGEVLGRHDGIVRYTIGQRRGLNIAVGEPLYVVALDASRAEVIVGPRDALRAEEIALSGVNWLGSGAFADLPADGLEIAVKVRSTQGPQAATLFAEPDGGARVHLAEGDYGVSPGQACVFYERHGARVLGGGWIAAAPSVGVREHAERVGALA